MTHHTRIDLCHRILGDAARPLDDQRPCSRSGHAPSTSANSIPDFQKYSQEDENENTSRFPAIKLTFRDPVNISQLKIIQVRWSFSTIPRFLTIYILEHYARTWTIIWK